MATFVSAGRLHRRSWSTLGMVYQRNSCRKTGSYAAVIMKPELLLARTRSIPTKRTRFKTSVHSSSFATCDQRLQSTSADVNGSLGQEDVANSEGGAGNTSEGKGRAENCGKKEGSFDGAALPTRRAGGGQRPVDPFPYDREAAVVRICKNLRNHEPTKYAFLAGLYPSKRDPQLKTLKELPLSESRKPRAHLAAGTSPSDPHQYPADKLPELRSKESYLRPPKTSTDKTIKRSLADGSLMPLPGKEGTGPSALVTPEVKTASEMYYEDTTVDYIRRLIDESYDPYVVENKPQLLHVLDQLSATDKDHLVMTDTEIEDKCVELFKGFPGHAKFGIGYLFYLNRGLTKGRSQMMSENQGLGWGDKFLTKIVTHYGHEPEKLIHEEIISMMLMLYLKQSPRFFPEGDDTDILDLVDPTFLQHAVTDVLARPLSKPSAADAEACAVLLGIKKLTNFELYLQDCREAVFHRLSLIGTRLSNPSYEVPDVDAISMINLAVVQSIVTLHAGGGVHFRTDPSTSIRKVFEAFRDALLAYDKDHGFVIDPVSAVKLASFGVQRGSFHDPILTETTLERLHLGGQVKQLSLRNLVSVASFLANARITGKLEGLTVKVAENVAKELSVMEDDGTCTVSDVRMVLQAWLHLASFNLYDTGRVGALVEEINMMHQQDFEPLQNSDLSRNEQKAQLGRKMGEICYQVLFPVSFGRSQGAGGGVSINDRDARDMVRLVAQLERSVVLYQPDFKPVLDKRKLARMNQLTQDQVPALVYSSNRLPAVGVSRRERLLSAAYNGLVVAMGKPHFVGIVHLLPHMRDADIVIGHLGGMPLFQPLEWTKDDPLTDFRRAPEYGQWVVVSVDGPSIHDRSLAPADADKQEDNAVNPRDIGGVASRDTEPDKYSQLLKLGFEIHVVPASDQDILLKGHSLKWAHRVMANVLTGNPQGNITTRTGDSHASGYLSVDPGPRWTGV